MAEKDEAKVTFVLTGPREGQTVTLGNRYSFYEGKLMAPASRKEGLKKILCNYYACNIAGEAPMWETKDGGSVKVRAVEVPKKETTTVKEEPRTSTVAPSPKK